MEDVLNSVSATHKKLRLSLSPDVLTQADLYYYNGDCQILSQSAEGFSFLVSSEDVPPRDISIIKEDSELVQIEQKKTVDWDAAGIACLQLMEEELKSLEPHEYVEHKKYSREGMIQRVLQERRDKAAKAKYHIEWADNIYGDHILTNENGVKYKLFLRDFDNETGYSDSMDAKTNKLGTTKHLMFAFNQLKENKTLYNSLKKTCPFVEIYLDPLNNYSVSWFFQGPLPLQTQMLLSKYFGRETFISDGQIPEFLGFLNEAQKHSEIRIRPEVPEKIEAFYEKKVLNDLQETEKADFSMLQADLYPYQKEGIQFASFRKAAILADDMGLGKTLQAIGTALNKKTFFGFERTLIICPASLKSQWKKEIEKFTSEKAIVTEGTPDERAAIYRKTSAFFIITNYEAAMRDQAAINKAGTDFLILDEAQRVKNFATKTAAAIGRLNKKHALAITGTPIENRLIDIFSIVNIMEPGFLGPLWEFSYQHCLFDPAKHDKINGYYDLQTLKERIQPLLLRREKRNVLDQLPNLRQINIPVGFSPIQADYHASYARGVSQIVRKKILTPFDLQRLQLLLANMRMVCDSTYLVDEATNDSPKLDELKFLLLEKLEIKKKKQKIIIFSEWVKMLKIIGRMLRENGIGFVELTGSVPVKNRGALISRFEEDDNVKVFLSSEAGGSGLNLQAADTLIHFELPWNPAKKNQRVGRINRIGQTNKHLTIISFITKNSIEERIAAGLEVKQNLFDGVLDEGSKTDMVDFSEKGRSQFLKQIESFIGNLEEATPDEQTTTEEEIQEEIEEQDNETTKEEESIDLSGDNQSGDEEKEPVSPSGKVQNEGSDNEIEQVMNNGLQFLSGLLKMSTGKDLGMENQEVRMDKETGEVTIKFKLPGMGK
ncbi:MAG: DEAD/DEAH box helicase [Marinilabilia sp.]